ncbi:MAG: hypothetical protein HY748_05130 [Elusimicrobia bacterium]|nr:hypothetical protein [Elusimicrobiota bacterium]
MRPSLHLSGLAFFASVWAACAATSPAETPRIPAALKTPEVADEAFVSDDDLLIKDGFTLKGGVRLSPAEVRADVSILVYALQNAFVGKGIVPDASYLETLSRLKGVVEAAGAGDSSESLCGRLAGALSAIGEVPHLAVSLEGYRCLPPGVVAEETAPSVGRNIMEEPSDPRPPGRTDVSTRPAGLFWTPSVDIPWKIEWRDVGGARVPVLGIREFHPFAHPAWRGLWDRMGALLRESPAVILDLRGNEGGDYEPGCHLARFFWGQEYPTPATHRTALDTAAACALAYNAKKIRLLASELNGLPEPAYLQEDMRKDMEGFLAAKSSATQAVESFEFSRPTIERRKLFRRPIYVLADERCASACELALLCLREHPRVRILGRSTQGSYRFGNVGVLVLPNSQIVVQVPRRFLFIKGREPRDAAGLEPDLLVPVETDAIEAALDALGREL